MVAVPFCPSWAAVGEQVTAGYAAIFFSLYRKQLSVIALVLDVLTYLALAFGYFNFVNVTVPSLRIRLLEEMRDAGGTLPARALMTAYDSRQLVAIRLERLVRGGHLVENDGRLHVGRLPFLITARIFDGLHGFIFGRRRKRQS